MNFIKTHPFENSYGLRFRGVGISGMGIAGQSTNIDYKLTEDRYLNGCQPILKGHVFGDTITFRVVDKDNILGYGVGAILDEFSTTWNLADDKQDQGVFKTEYPAKIVKDLYIRVSYNSTGQNNVQVACNLFLHKIPT